MADSNITCLALVAQAGIASVTLTWLYSDPNFNGLNYLELDAVEVWASSTTSRSNAAKVGEGETFFVHPVPEGATRRYWVRARNNSGSYGDWYPLSATGGVTATAGSATPGPNSIGTSQLQNDAVTPAKMSVSSISAISANLGSITAGSVTGVTFTGGIFRTASSGRRVLIDEDVNAIQVFNSSGVLVGRLGQLLGSSTVLEASFGGLSPTAYITNNSAGPALGAFNSGNGDGVNIINSGTGNGLRASANNNSALGAFVTNSAGHAVRGRNTGGGGSGLLGVNPTGGGYGVYTETGGYGPFTGQHDAMIRIEAEIEPGDIVYDVNVIARNGIDDTLTEVSRSTKAKQKAVIGVASRRVRFDATSLLSALPSDQPTYLRKLMAGMYDRLTINSVGEGQINVCGLGGDIEAGDLIVASDMPGKGMRQDDDIVRGCTVAKARESVTFDFPEQRRTVAAIYVCG